MSENAKDQNSEAYELLENMNNMWSDVSTDDQGEESRTPASLDEVNASMAILEEFYSMNVTIKEYKDWADSLKDMLATYKEIFESEEPKDDEVAQLLEEVFMLWTEISYHDEAEYRSPKNWKEIRASRALLKKANMMTVEDDQLLARIEELEDVLNSAEKKIPNHSSRVIASLIFSVVILLGLVFLLSWNTFELKEVSYDAEWFTTGQNGNLFWTTLDDKEEQKAITRKIYLPRNTKLEPLGRKGKSWIQVKTPNGDFGFIDFKLLNGSKHRKAKAGARIFMKIGAEKEDTLTSGSMVTVLERKTQKVNYGSIDYIKIKLADGKVRWARDKQFEELIFEGIPKLNPDYFIATTIATARKQILGKTKEAVEKRYGIASSFFQTQKTDQAYYAQLVVTDTNNRQRKGLIVNFNKNDTAFNLNYIDEGESRFYNKFPLMNFVRSQEYNKTMAYHYYLPDQPLIKWWTEFKTSNWLTKIIYWVLGIVYLTLCLFIFYSLARQLVSPLMQVFTYNRVFANGFVKFVNFLLMFLATYMFFLFAVTIMDIWFLPLIAFLGTVIFWYIIHSHFVEYDRCPSCHTMYSALDKGSTKTGKSKSTSYEHKEKDLGYRSRIEGNIEYREHHYQTWSEKTTDIYQHSLDHRSCALCGYEWDIALSEKIDSYTEEV